MTPWCINGQLWRIGARSAEGRTTPAFAGYRQGLYGADTLSEDRPALLLEGELDALVVRQEAGDLVVPVATGGVTSARQARWVAQLARLPQVLVAFDNDAEGDRAAAWWLEVLPHNTQRCRPVGAKDPNDMLVKAAMDLRQWLGVLPEVEAEEDSGWRRWWG